ncbi:antirestriction protein ArdA [Erythrobacter sp. HL-111]|uniref:antirestriction protein ArdA n=1 Tax=Erythrobacter sp. HL-111 TaxID=1798193 RepID=UPI00087C79B2|nr:antirestriction protein ArdA [Erythrobacter sp. HL-111]SDR67556.1 Antirestriction protein (ArdA) [Erythrobacter sp. HL-111]SDT14960.1 Antirestriction protein (ArdA) [Erythrobacter sp. HL-111]
MSNRYHATPYDISATGFYFDTYEEYQARAAVHRNEYGDPVEEYEIQFIDGDSYRLFDAIGVNQANLKDWFERFEDMDDDEAVKLIILIEHFGYSVEDALDRIDDLHLFEGTAIQYAEELIESTGMLDQMPENLRYYFDTEAFARDMVLGGDITPVEIDGRSYIADGV